LVFVNAANLKEIIEYQKLCSSQYLIIFNKLSDSLPLFLLFWLLKRIFLAFLVICRTFFKWIMISGHAEDLIWLNYGVKIDKKRVLVSFDLFFLMKW